MRPSPFCLYFGCNCLLGWAFPSLFLNFIDQNKKWMEVRQKKNLKKEKIWPPPGAGEREDVGTVINTNSSKLYRNVKPKIKDLTLIIVYLNVFSLNHSIMYNYVMFDS